MAGASPAGRPLVPRRATQSGIVFLGLGIAVAAIARGKLAGVLLCLLGGVGIAIGAVLLVLGLSYRRRSPEAPGATGVAAAGALIGGAGIAALVWGAVRLG